MTGFAHNQIEELVERQLEVARDLASLLEQERLALTGSSAHLVSEVASRKVALLQTFERLERERRRVCAENALPEDPAGADASAGSGFTQAIAQRWQSLMSLLAACRSANETNGLIIQMRRGQVRQLIDIVRGTPAITYGPRGQTLAAAVRPLARA